MTALSQEDRRRERICELNDAFRRAFAGGRIILTTGFNALPESAKQEAFDRIKTFDASESGDDPYCEHDFVRIQVDGQKVFAKIDYYDRAQFDYYNRDLRYHSQDPSDPEQTTRVMTIMLASEY